jgi:hypothetical protein
MPRKKKPKPNLLEQYAEARKLLEEAQKRVAHLEHQIEPLRQMLIAELAATGSPQERPDEEFDLGATIEDGLSFEASRRQIG